MTQKVNSVPDKFCNYLSHICSDSIKILKISCENTTPKLLKTNSTKTWDNWIVITKTKDNQSLRPWIGLVGYVRETDGLEQDNCSYAYLSVLGLACDKNTSNAVSEHGWCIGKFVRHWHFLFGGNNNMRVHNIHAWVWAWPCFLMENAMLLVT